MRPNFTYAPNSFEEAVIDPFALGDYITFYKFYVKVEDTSDKGRVWSVSRTPQDGYHVHPAFIRNGKEINGFVFYKAKTAVNDGINLRLVSASIDKRIKYGYEYKSRNYLVLTPEEAGYVVENLNKYGSGLDYHILNIYEMSAMHMIYMANSSPSVGNNYINVSDYGIPMNCVIDGIDVYKQGTDENDKDVYTLRIMDNQGTGNMIDTGIKIGTDVRYRSIQTSRSRFIGTTGDGFDLKDTFIIAPENQPHFDYEFDNDNVIINNTSGGFYYSNGVLNINDTACYIRSNATPVVDDNGTEFYFTNYFNYANASSLSPVCPYQCFGIHYSFLQRYDKEKYQSLNPSYIADGNQFSFLKNSRIVAPDWTRDTMDGLTTAYGFKLQASPADYDNGYYQYSFTQSF